MKLRRNLRDCGHERVFVNEDLTRSRSELLFEARNLVKQHKIVGAWSSARRENCTPNLYEVRSTTVPRLRCYTLI